MKMIIVVVLSLLLFCNTAIAESWNVTWTPIKESIIDKEYIITVQNMQTAKKDVDISSFFTETNFDISGVSDVKFYEWKDIPYTYTVDHYDEVEHSEYHPENGTWYYWTESVYSHTETVESVKLDWKVCKSQLFKETGTTKEDNYGFINIPAYGSKPKDDGTYNGTKTFKLSFRTPIVYDGSYGSFGKVALLLDGEEHHPYWDTAWSHKEEIILTGGASGAQTDFQILFNVSYETGMQADFDDLRFTNDTHEIDSWLESKVDSSYALVWVEFPTTPANEVNQTYYMYYGNNTAADNWDGDATFLEFDNDTNIIGDEWGTVGGTWDTTSDGGNTVRRRTNGAAVFGSPSTAGTITDASYTDFIIDTKIKHDSSSVDPYWTGVQFRYTDNDNRYYAYIKNDGNVKLESITSGTIDSYAGSYAQNTWHDLSIKVYETTIKISVGGIERINITNSDESTGKVGYFNYNFEEFELYNKYDNFRVRKYAANPPTYEFGSTQYYTDSIHYNTTNPYNHTIESTGTITANHTITAADDIYWTAAALSDDCNLVVTEYNYTNNTLTNFTIYSNTLDWLQITNLTPTRSYELQYANGTAINTTIANVNGIINYTKDFTPDNYQLVSNASVIISLYSTYPSTIHTNYTGLITANYIIKSYYLLNFSSLAALFGVNYTLDGGDMHSYLKIPANSIASEGIYRAHNRNTTPYMNWESNDMITNGNVWQWSGGNINDIWIQNTSINDTHTWINISGVASNVFPSMFYLDRLSMYQSEKTGIEINKGQGIIFKIFDLEQYRGRSNDYYISLYLDTQIEATPDSNIEIWYCNDSFDPTTDDPCDVCDYKDSWSSGRWLDYESWQPQGNVSYSKPLTIHAGTQTCACPPTEVNYIYLKSDTVPSKSFILNATNVDPGICNLTYAQTETMWLRNEIAGTNTPYTYTPSAFIMYVRDYLDFVHHLYVANNQDVWGHSNYNTVPIGISNVVPTFCKYNYFWWNGTTDYNMTGVYENNFWVNLTYGYDPDNDAALTHVLSLYDDDYNFIAFINDSLVGNQSDTDVYIDISDYNSGYYKFKIVSTDNENTTSISWSNEFELKKYHPFLEGAYHFYDEMEDGLTDFRDGMGRYLVWGFVFFGVGLIFVLIAKIKQTIIGGK